MGVPLAQVVEVGKVVAGPVKETPQWGDGFPHHAHKRREGTPLTLNGKVAHAVNFVRDVFSHQDTTDLLTVSLLQRRGKPLLNLLWQKYLQLTPPPAVQKENPRFLTIRLQTRD